MKIFGTALRILFGALVFIISLAFVIIEGALLVTLDFALYENQLLALLQLLLKLAILIAALVLSAISVIRCQRSFLPESLCLFASALATAPFISNNFGIYFSLLAALFVLGQLMFKKSKIKERFG